MWESFHSLLFPFPESGFPLLKPAVISQLEERKDLENLFQLATGTDSQGLWTECTAVQSGNNLTKEVHEEEKSTLFELQKDFSQETNFSNVYFGPTTGNPVSRK